MINLVNILNQIDESDGIWGELFTLCSIDFYETNKIKKKRTTNNKTKKSTESHNTETITEQCIADFIALSIKYYCYDSKLDSSSIGGASNDIKLTHLDK